ELGRAERRLSRHEIFPEEIGVLHHGALERLKNYAAFFQVFRNDIALDELVVREDHPTRVLLEAAGIFKNVFAVVFREWRTRLERSEIEKTNIRESPSLIFSRRLRQGFELIPCHALLLAEPLGQIAQLRWTGKNRSGFSDFLICEQRHSKQNDGQRAPLQKHWEVRQLS